MNNDALDAARYRWLRDTFTTSVGAFLNAKERALYYEDVPEDETFQLQWYPNTPVGFCLATGRTFDEAVDSAMAGD